MDSGSTVLDVATPARFIKSVKETCLRTWILKLLCDYFIKQLVKCLCFLWCFNVNVTVNVKIPAVLLYIQSLWSQRKLNRMSHQPRSTTGHPRTVQDHQICRSVCSCWNMFVCVSVSHLVIILTPADEFYKLYKPEVFMPEAAGRGQTANTSFHLCNYCRNVGAYSQRSHTTLHFIGWWFHVFKTALINIFYHLTLWLNNVSN